MLKHLELQVNRQAAGLQDLSAQGAALLEMARRERATANGLAALLGVKDELSANARPPTRLAQCLPFEAQSQQSRVQTEWATLVKEASIALQAEGISPEQVQLPRSEHELDTMDVVSALALGAIGAFLPSFRTQKVGRGLVGDAFHNLQEAADKNKLPQVVQSVFGRKPAAFMDAGAKGVFHRFQDGHDLLTAVPEGVRALGWVRGPLEVFQHLLRDSFGGTGVPLPGSDLIGKSFASLGGAHVSEFLSPHELSKYAAFRMTDTVATGTTAALVSIYAAARKIPAGSMRLPQLGMLAHGLCFLGIAACSTIPGVQLLAARRSHLNYVSLLAVAKHAWVWHGMTNRLRLENDDGSERIRATREQLEVRRADLTVDAMDDQLRLAAYLTATGENTP
ncbi:MAG TPA: hypothetical protein VI197_01295 [Polyangiaceae bacterium]